MVGDSEGYSQADDKIAELCALEALKRLKARYCYGIDQHDWQLWREQVFAPEASLSIPSIGLTVTGAEAIIAWVKERWKNMISVHHAHMPDLEILSPTEARGRWAMDDRLYRRSAPHQLLLHGFGYYDETYLHLECGWRILSTTLTRLHVERV